MDKVFINYGKKLLTINIAGSQKAGKDGDIQTITEIINENVYRVDEGKLTKDKIVVDLGANIGIFSLQVASLGAAKIYAVEPNPRNIEILEKNVLANNLENTIAVIGKALTATDNDLVNMVDCDRDSHFSGLEGIESDYSKELTKGYDRRGHFNATGVSLDALLAEIEEVDIMKVDIEWAEYPAFTQVSKETMDKIKYLVFEFHGTDQETFGKMVANLTKSFCVETLGSYERGGFLFCRRY